MCFNWTAGYRRRNDTSAISTRREALKVSAPRQAVDVPRRGGCREPDLQSIASGMLILRIQYGAPVCIARHEKVLLVVSGY